MEQGISDLVTRVPCVVPDEFGFDDFEERLDHSIVPAILFSAHRYFEAQLAHPLLIVMRAILAAPVCVMNAAGRIA